MDQNTGNTPKNAEKNAIYHWSYAEQVALDEQKDIAPVATVRRSMP